MARAVRNPKIDTRSARAKLSPRREPYWTPITPGCAIGYRKGATGGTWIAKRYDQTATPPRTFRAIGPADDAMDPDGVAAISFGQAQEKARAWFSEQAHLAQGIEPGTGPYTVSDALDAYVAKRQAEAQPSLRDARSHAAMIRPVLGKLELRQLTADRLRNWLGSVASAPRRARARKGEGVKFLELPESDEAKRARRATANRVWNTLRAALNHAFAEGKTPTDAAWKRVKSFRGADSARVRFLTVAESQRLINASAPDFRDIVTAALLTGARYGELCRLNVEDYSTIAGTLIILQSKSGKSRHVYLTDEGRAFFDRLATDRAATAPLLLKANGERWSASDQARPMQATVAAARIDPTISFHGLRHTYASLSVMNGAPLQVVAHNLGHTTTRMVEKHYSHLAPSYVADTIRRTAPTFGLSIDRKVVPMRRGKML